MVEVSGWLLVGGGFGLAFVGFFTGIGQAAGKHFYDVHLAKHTDALLKAASKNRDAFKYLLTGRQP
jgi:hypothetical protein